MKAPFTRILILLLVCCMMLAGCNNAPVATEPTTEPTVPTTKPLVITSLSAGFGRVNISPTEPTPLRGYGFSSGRMSSDIQDPLYATCIALTDSGLNTVLIFTVDLTNSYTEVMDAARLMISDATGVPVDAIMVSATHNHSSPDLLNLEEPSVLRYIESLKAWMVQAATLAMRDRAETTVHIATAETENLNFVRRYQLQNGTYAGDNFGSFKSAPIACHETEVDNDLQLVLLKRENKKDIMLANFQTHPHRESSSTSTNVTADLIAPFREKIESTLDCHVAYFTGSSGNVNPTSKIPEENITSNYIEQGHALADYALAAYDSFKEIPANSVRITKTIYKGKVDHTYSRWGSIAVEAINHYMKNGEIEFYKQFFNGSGIKNVYQLNAVAQRSLLPPEAEISLYAIALGDLSFVTVPFEMFDTNGMEIKNGSPYSMTFVLTCANDNLGYLPSALAVQHGGYAVDVTLFKTGTAEELVSCYLEMLNNLYYKK